jgi:hypothetical protein
MDNTFSSSYKIKQQSTGLPQTNWTYILMQTWQKTTTHSTSSTTGYKFRRPEKLESTISTKTFDQHLKKPKKKLIWM